MAEEIPTENKPAVRICGQCQHEFNLTAQVQKANKEQGIGFTHGVCIRHVVEFYKGAEFTDEQIKNAVEKMKADKQPPTPDLKEHPELVKNYEKGIFTPEQLQQSKHPAEPVQPTQAAESLQEKWKRLNKVLGR